jgi:hypothetical protein
MLKKYMLRDFRRCFCRTACAWVYIASLSLLHPTRYASASEFSDSAAFRRRYSLTGSLELSYDRSWSQGGGGGKYVSDDFRQLLLLDHHGFVADPNLVTYGVSGIVSHDAGKGIENTTLLGENLGITLFHALPDRWIRNEDYIPHPFWLRFSHNADASFEYTSYGISFMHFVKPKQRFLVTEKAKPEGADSDLYEDGPSRTSRIVEKELAFPVPRTFFDYDHYEVKDQDSRTRNDILSLRSTLSGKFYEYRFLFEKRNETGNLALNKTVYQLEPVYRFYDKGTRRRIDIRSFLRYEEVNQGQSTELASNLGWSRPLGKDSIALTANLGYTGTSAAGQTVASYAAVAGGAYTRHLSSSLANNTQLTASYTKSGNVENHFERVMNTVSGDISRIIGGTASVFAGNGAQGIEYGANTTLYTKTRINVSLGYSYSLTSSQEPASTNLPSQTSTNTPVQTAYEKIAKQSLTLRAAGPLLHNLSFQSSAEYTMADVPVTGGGTGTEETGSVSSNLLWRLQRTTITLGGNYTRVKRSNDDISATSSMSLYSTLSRSLTHGMFFNLYNSWTRAAATGARSIASDSLQIKPTLRWTRGLTTVDTEYSYTRTTGGEESTDSRLFVRLVRKFSAQF